MSHLRAATEQLTASIAVMQRGTDLAEQGNHLAAAGAFSAAAGMAEALAAAAAPVSAVEATKWSLIAHLRRGWAALEQRRAGVVVGAARHVLV